MDNKSKKKQEVLGQFVCHVTVPEQDSKEDTFEMLALSGLS